jgi:transposase
LKKKQEITDWLNAHQAELVTGKLVVFFEDECHLLWGDVTGYVWGKRKDRIEVPVVNQRDKQTYYGALNVVTGKCLVQSYKKGDSAATIAFLQYLLQQCPDSRIALLWDGASYHRSQEVKAFLEEINQGLDPDQWRITCLRFAPNAPEQNPIEDVWLQAKRFIREYYMLCRSFPIVKRLFEFATQHQRFSFAKLSLYGSFS